MNEQNRVVEMLSETRVGAKLKSITMIDCPNQKNHSLITFIFEGEVEGEERHIDIYGEDLQVATGWVGQLVC